MKTLKRKYVIKNVEISGQCYSCKKDFKQYKKEKLYYLEPEFGKLNNEDKIQLCENCKKLELKYIIEELQIAGQCDLCKRWFKGKQMGSERPPKILVGEFDFQQKLVLCTSCFEKKHLGGFENES